MRRRHVGPASLALLLGVLISSLSVLAYASPPDPWWGRGVYDDADFDDVVCLIITKTGLVEDAALMEGLPDFVLIGVGVQPDDQSAGPFSLSSTRPRAPPVS
jgi:hypothetical protein